MVAATRRRDALERGVPTSTLVPVEGCVLDHSEAVRKLMTLSLARPGAVLRRKLRPCGCELSVGWEKPASVPLDA